MTPAARVAIVTGASRGIGRAVAVRLAQEGTELVLGHARDAAAMDETVAACRAAGADPAVVRIDVTAADAPAALVGAALARGRLDVLVNNAGAVADDLLAVATDADLDRMLAVNIAALTRLTRAALRPMLRQRGGAIVNLSSVLATRPGRGNAIYAGTKGFVEAFTRALAVEVGGKGIRVNAVAPGIIATGMTRAVQALAGAALRERVALRRLGTAAEVAAAVAFLCSADAAYVSGAILAVDGGFTGGP
ncbi:MAG TPA: SDR family oxidoreductase [Polyangia bacterium]